MEEDQPGNGAIKSRRYKSKANTAQPIEAIAQGGEYEFVKRLIDESREHPCLAHVFTTMLGKKSSVKMVLQHINQYDDIKSCCDTEFCQGKTIRYGIAWTFDEHLDLGLVPQYKHRKGKERVYSYQIPKQFHDLDLKYNLPAIAHRIQYLIMDDLNIENVKLVHQSKHQYEFWLSSSRNTWTGQRRKRRERERQLKALGGVKPNESPQSTRSMDPDSSSAKHETSSSTARSEGDSLVEDVAVVKRQRDSSLEFDPNNQSGGDVQARSKRLKSEDDQQEQALLNQLMELASWKEDEQRKYLMSCSLKLKRVKYCIFLILKTRMNCSDKETTFQLFQYFKNKLV